MIIDAGDWRTKTARQAREDAYLAGKIPLLETQWILVNGMVESARAQLEFHEDGVWFLEADCATEETLVWEETGIDVDDIAGGRTWCRCRVDRRTAQRAIFFDYKTTGQDMNPSQWGTRALINYGYDIQKSLYKRGCRAVFGADPAFLFVVQETTPPFALAVITNTPTGEAIGDAKVDFALKTWTWCNAHDLWPGYPLKTMYVDPPAWEKYEWIKDDDQIRTRDVPSDLSKLWLKFQAPAGNA